MINRVHQQFNLQSREHQLINQDNYTHTLQAYMENCGAYSPSSIRDPKYIRILDTTLRDGEQAPGASMSAAQKLSIARQLALLHVDIIEAGFPASSREDFDAVKAVADEIGTRVDERGYVPVIAAVARCSKRDIDAAWEAVKGARRPRIGTFLATSELHMKHKLNMGREDVVAKAVEMVRYATRLGCPDVSFAAEDATRSDREFLYRVLEEVIKAGATTVIIPDTVGYTLPSEYRQLILDIKSNTKGIENVIIASHCHNDLGLATANTLAGAEGGARQLEVTINGIGERAGNAGLEEVVMALKCKKGLLGGLYTGISTKYIYPISKMVVEYSGLHVQPHKAIVGANAFAHQSGIHQDGILKFRGTYEIISPEDIGLLQSNGNGIILGRLSGRHAVKAKVLKLGYDLNEQELDDVFRKFKEVVKNKKHITDGDIESLITTNTTDTEPIWTLSNFQITHGNIGYSTATVELKDLDMKERTATTLGDGPVDACFKAINSILQVPVTLVEYENSTILGNKLLTSTRVVISERKTDSTTFSGKGDDVDIIVSSIKAYLSALNKMLNYK